MSQTRSSRPDPPSGTVTFLFTDIEGSTKLWDAHPELMRTSLARHDSLMRAAIASANGHVFKTIGDAFCATFAAAPEAAKATISCQLALAAEPWPAETPIKVRMALHTGSVESRDNDYFGPPVNRVARLLAIGHGGQSLLSQTTYELLRDSLSEGVVFRNLGEHRLKDLSRAETVFQLCHPDLPAEFPPLRSLENPDLKHNLPRHLTSFIGRENELTEVRALLEKTRLLTLTGSGGTGKTRLAIQAAAEVLEQYADGVWLVELAALSDPALVPRSFAGVLGLKEESGVPILRTLTEYLRNRRLLLVLDNCEHLLDACAKLAHSVLLNCPGVVILTTGREGLGIGGELTYRVPSLSLPDPKLRYTARSLSHFESVRLFTERAQFHQPSFVVRDQNASALASICRRLDGIPLALELAAARIRSLTVEEINSKLDQRFRLLTGGSRTAMPRQQTLRSLIDWSYELLNPTEKALLNRLSVFAGGSSLVAVEQVCAGDPVEDWEALDLLTSLYDKSLVVVEPRDDGSRYRLLETVRQYARDRLFETGEAPAWRDRHLACMLSLAEEASGQLNGPDQQIWLERLEVEHDNLRAALDWSGEEARNAGRGLCLAGALWRYWLVRGHLSEGRERLSRALAGSMDDDSEGSPASRARALNGAGVLAWYQSDYAAAQAYHEESLAIRRALDDGNGIAASLNNLGNLTFDLGDYAAARSLYEESLSMSRELGDRRGVANALNNVGNVAFEQGDFAAARTLYEESLTIFRELGNLRGVANALNNIGNVAHEQGDYTATRSFYLESLTLLRELGDRQGIAITLVGLADLAAAVGAPREASRLWGAAERLCEEIGAPLQPNGQVRYEMRVAAARMALGDDAAFDAAWQEGRALTMEQAADAFYPTDSHASDSR